MSLITNCCEGWWHNVANLLINESAYSYCTQGRVLIQLASRNIWGLNITKRIANVKCFVICMLAFLMVHYKIKVAQQLLLVVGVSLDSAIAWPLLNSAQSDFTGTIKKCELVKRVKKYYSCQMTYLYFIHLNEFRGHTSFLEWAHAFMVPIVHSSRHFRGFAINNTIHQTL